MKGMVHQVHGRSRSDVKDQETLEKTTVCEDKRSTVGMLGSCPLYYRSPAKQFLSLETRLSKNVEMGTAYSDLIKTGKDSGYIRKLDPIEICDTRNDSRWYVPHHPVFNPNKHGKERRLSNADSENEGLSLNKNLLIGPDLLQNLKGIIYRFEMSADFDKMFLQVKVPVADAKCLRLFGEKINLMTYQPMSTPATFSVPWIPLLLRIMPIYRAPPRITKTNIPMLKNSQTQFFQG